MSDSYTQARLCLDNTKPANQVRKVKAATLRSLHGIPCRQLRLWIADHLKSNIYMFVFFFTVTSALHPTARNIYMLKK